MCCRWGNKDAKIALPIQQSCYKKICHAPRCHVMCGSTFGPISFNFFQIGEAEYGTIANRGWVPMRYLPSKNWALSDLYERKSHQSFGEKVSTRSCNLLKPSPPSSVGKQRFFHLLNIIHLTDSWSPKGIVQILSSFFSNSLGKKIQKIDQTNQIEPTRVDLGQFSLGN